VRLGNVHGRLIHRPLRETLMCLNAIIGIGIALLQIRANVVGPSKSTDRNKVLQKKC
jgi:hypothetical protein